MLSILFGLFVVIVVADAVGVRFVCEVEMTKEETKGEKEKRKRRKERKRRRNEKKGKSVVLPVFLDAVYSRATSNKFCP